MNPNLKGFEAELDALYRRDKKQKPDTTVSNEVVRIPQAPRMK